MTSLQVDEMWVTVKESRCPSFLCTLQFAEIVINWKTPENQAREMGERIWFYRGKRERVIGVHLWTIKVGSVPKTAKWSRLAETDFYPNHFLPLRAGSINSIGRCTDHMFAERKKCKKEVRASKYNA